MRLSVLCLGDLLMSRRFLPEFFFNEGYNTGIKKWGTNWYQSVPMGTQHPRISQIPTSKRPRLSSCDDEGIACLQPSAAVDGVMSVLERDKGLRIPAVAHGVFFFFKV